MAQNHLKKGRLITFEGPEGSGKSTHAQLLAEYLRRKGVAVLRLREPGGTKIGERIRRILLEPKNKNMDAVCEMLLYQASRAQLVWEKVRPALRKKQVVILDRFLDATVCYQGYGAKLDIRMIKAIGALATYGLVPELTILLDIGVEAGLRRSRRLDRMEKKPLAFHRKVRKGYLKLAQANPRRIKVVAVTGDIARTQKVIRKIVSQKLHLPFKKI